MASQAGTTMGMLPRRRTHGRRRTSPQHCRASWRAISRDHRCGADKQCTGGYTRRARRSRGISHNLAFRGPHCGANGREASKDVSEHGLFASKVVRKLLSSGTEELCPLRPLLNRGLEFLALLPEALDILLGLGYGRLAISPSPFRVDLLRELLIPLVTLPPPSLLFEDLAQLQRLLAFRLRLLPTTVGLCLEPEDFRRPAALLVLPCPDVLHLVLQKGLLHFGHAAREVCGAHLREVPKQRHRATRDLPETVFLRIELGLGDLRKHLFGKAFGGNGRPGAATGRAAATAAATGGSIPADPLG
mmetsp:Transcript_70989/g.205790  ORF Transcript_70989/g.205790 Transcript_70989/m.205790 type:complete len:303 (+) Transcript_70989:61-969(+)